MRRVYRLLARVFRPRPPRCADAPPPAPQNAKLDLIRTTRGAGFDTLDFADYLEFSLLLEAALEHEEPFLFGSGARLARLLQRFAAQMPTDLVLEVLQRSLFLDEDGWLLATAEAARVEAALTAASPVLSVRFSRQQQRDVAHAIRCLDQDFSVVRCLHPDLLGESRYAIALAKAFPLRLGWALSPARRVLELDLFGLRPLDESESGDDGEAAGYALDGVGLDTVPQGDVFTGALMLLLRGWLLTPGCVRRLDDSVRDAYRADSLGAGLVSGAARAKFEAFARRHVDPRIVRGALAHVWADASRIPGGRAILKELVCMSPNLDALRLPAPVLTMILNNALRLCRHVRTAAGALQLERAARERADIVVTRVEPSVEVRLVPGGPGATTLFAPSRDEFFRLHRGRVMVRECNTDFMWGPELMGPYLRTAPYAEGEELACVHAPQASHRNGKLHLNVLGMFLSDETRRMLPGAPASPPPMTRGDHEWLARLLADMPAFGEAVVDGLMMCGGVREGLLASPGDPLAGLPAPCTLVLTGAPSEPRAVRVVACGSAAALEEAVARFFYRFGDEDAGTLAGAQRCAREARAAGAPEMRFFAFLGVTHAQFLGVVTTAIAFEEFEPELRRSPWWEPMLNEAVLRLHEEHRAHLLARHHRLLAAQLLAWANRIGLAFLAPPPPARPLFPGRRAPAYPDKTAAGLRAACQALSRACVDEYLRGADMVPAPAAPRGARLFHMLFMDCHGVAPSYAPLPGQERGWARVQAAQAEAQAAGNRWSPCGGPAFWAWFLARVAHHINAGSAGRVCMPRVRTRREGPATSFFFFCLLCIADPQTTAGRPTRRTRWGSWSRP